MAEGEKLLITDFMSSEEDIDHDNFTAKMCAVQNYNAIQENARHLNFSEKALLKRDN